MNPPPAIHAIALTSPPNTTNPPRAIHPIAASVRARVLRPIANRGVVVCNKILDSKVVSGLVPAKVYHMLATHLTNSFIQVKWNSIVMKIIGCSVLPPDQILTMLGVWVVKSLFKRGVSILFRHGICHFTNQHGTAVEDSCVNDLIVDSFNCVTSEDVTGILFDPLFM